ncbi:D-altritol 5-dehydrogenase-like [Bacillus rossius redtenbacheri]|uniref:D-altritol 5-dehydrogenase-like n=1 Tax=Bacillus rossius redtenbacheri TaxID=93214 RepID=UPI002FDCD094
MRGRTMLALQFDGKASRLGLRTLSVPEPRGREVLVRVAFSGVCGTDLHVLKGEFPCRQSGAVTLGHEFSGVVHAVGAQVTTVREGDEVAVNPDSGCDRCSYCRSGKYNYCDNGGSNNAIGLFRHGGWAEYCLVPEPQVHPLPRGMSLEQASLMEPLSCLCHGLDLVGPMPVGSAILIQGAGIIGNLWACALHHQGHRKVIISKPSEARRKALRKLDTGCEIVSPGELRQKGRDPGWGVDFVIDCSGHAPAIEKAVSLLSCGGTLCIFGVAPPDARISVSPNLLYKKEIRIIAVNNNPYSSEKALGLIGAMGERYLDYDKLGVHTYKLCQYAAAIEDLRNGTITKAMFVIEQPDLIER